MELSWPWLSLRGATHVLGIDIESNAVLNARDNVTLNPNIDPDVVTFELGDRYIDEMDDDTWDVICANIQKNVLSLICPAMLGR